MLQAYPIRFLVSFTLFLMVVEIHAQLETNHWVCSDSIHIEFHKGRQVPTLDTHVTHFSSYSNGCVSGADGQFLFAVNDGFIHDRNFQLMPNGDSLNQRFGSHHEIILKLPGNNDKYLVIHHDSIDPRAPFGSRISDSLLFTEVDMSLNNGLGAVTQKNQFLGHNYSMGMDVTRHYNGRDLWLVMHHTLKAPLPSMFHSYSDTLVAFLVDSSGLSSRPVYSVLDTILSARIWDELRISPNGDIIAMTNSHIHHTNPGVSPVNRLVLCRFDSKTGKASSTISIPSASNGLSSNPMHLCFSKSGNKLYVNDYPMYRNAFMQPVASLAQFDLTSWNQQAIRSSRYNLVHQPAAPYPSGVPINNTLHDVQLGLDGKIYWSHFYDQIGVIHEPDSTGPKCDYQDSLFLLPPGSHSTFGKFPVFPASVYDFEPFQVRYTCWGDTTVFCLKDTAQVDSVLWNFGDPLSGQNSAASYCAKHAFSRVGEFTVIARIKWSTGSIDTLVQSVFIDSILNPKLPADTMLCLGDTIDLRFTDNAPARFFWSDSSATDSLLVDSGGWYWVEVYNRCGEWQDSIFISENRYPESTLPMDTGSCGDSLLLIANGSLGSTFLWSGGSMDSTQWIDSTGSYYLTVSNPCGSHTDSVMVHIDDSLQIDLGSDTVLCSSDTLWLNVPGSDVRWWDGDSLSPKPVAQTGIYWVDVKNYCGVFRDSLIVPSLYQPAWPDLGRDTLTCSHSPLTLMAGMGEKGAQYWWKNQLITDSIVTVLQSGLFHVSISGRCGEFQDSVWVQYLQTPQLDLRDTMLCEGDTLLVSVAVDSAQYLWSSGSTMSTHRVTPVRSYGLRVSNRCGADSAGFKVDTFPTLSVHFPVDTVICDQAPFQLDAANHSATYLWQDGSTSSNFSVLKRGRYFVTVSNPCKSSIHSIQVDFQVPPSPSILQKPEGKFCPGEPLRLIGVGNDSTTDMEWSTGDNSAEIQIDQPGEYTYTLTNRCGVRSAVLSPDYYPVKADFELNSKEGSQPFHLSTTNLSDSATHYAWVLDGKHRSREVNYSEVLSRPGTYEVKLVATGFYGCRDSLIDSVQVHWKPGALPLLCDFRIDPNPTKGRFTVSAMNNDKQVKGLKVFNTLGEQVYEVDVSHLKENPFLFEYEFPQLSSGTYLIGLYCENESVHKRVVVTR
ncbi:T9SS type A sorting domain-containing protein [bacterium SCSIO 12741]|nr:T9SS type A sorting domain-containing protein [bacterium SCSIO 12741]